MAITIQYATLTDAENIALLSRKTFYDTFAEFNTKENMEQFMEESFSIQALQDEVSAPENIFIIALMDGELVGYAKLTESKNPNGLENTNAIEIGRIYAAKKTIGHGIGKALMQECIRIASERKKQMIWLGVWEHNERAISFYSKFGFEKFGEHGFMLGSDLQTDWLMRKII